MPHSSARCRRRVFESNIINNAGTINLTGGASLGAPNGLVVNNTGTLNNVSGFGVINGSVANTGTIEVKGGSLDLAGGLSGAGSVIIDAGATLELSGANAQNITLSAGGGTLQLDNALGFTGTLAGTSSAAGNFAVNGPGNVNTASGDAIDFTSSGGALGNAATVALTTGGNLIGAVNGVMAAQNGVGDVDVATGGAVTGQSGHGILAEVSSSGTGNIVVNATGAVSGSGTGAVGVFAENLDAADGSNVTVTATGGASGQQNAIQASTKGAGTVSVHAG